MNKYIIKKIKAAPDEADWEMADIAMINLKPWEEGNPHFNSYAQLLYDDEAIYVRMVTDEMPVVAKQTKRNSIVCTDSCMEFFLNPNTNNPLYFNFEVNALGTFLIAVGTQRNDRIFCMDDEKQFKIEPQLCENGWQISYKIPFGFIRKYTGECTYLMKGNFYKCGDKTGHRHFGVWNMIKTQTPDFHQSEYFGELLFENK